MKNEKGFTIVELVIVIAVIAILAAVLIPTFSSIVKNANISSDTQLVRNMNVILASESVTEVPPSTTELVALLRASGIERIEPKTRHYTFYWLKSENRIILADPGDLPVYPEEFLYERYDGSNWFDITVSGGGYTPDVEHDFSGEPETFTVNLECNDPAGIVPIDTSTLTATEGERFDLTVKPATARHGLTKIVVTMEGSIRKTFFRGETGQSVNVSLDAVTGNISIYVTVKEFCTVTLQALTPEHVKTPAYTVQAELGVGFKLDLEYLEENVLLDPYEIVTARAEDGTDHHLASDGSITIPKLDGDTVITLDTKLKTFDVILTVDGVIVDQQFDIPYGEPYTVTHGYGNRRIGGLGIGVKITPNPKDYRLYVHPEIDLDYNNRTLSITIPQIKFNYNIRVELKDSDQMSG